MATLALEDLMTGRRMTLSLQALEVGVAHWAWDKSRPCDVGGNDGAAMSVICLSWHFLVRSVYMKHMCER